MMKRSLIIFILVAAATTVAGQQNNKLTNEVRDCSGKLRDAESAYQAGQFLSAIEVLEESLDSCDFARKEKEQALELLAKSYVEAGETGKAETTVNILLKKFPHYDLREERNPEMFNRMVKRYEIHPKLTVGLKSGAYWPRFTTIKTYSVLDGVDYSPGIQDSGYFFTYYGYIEYEFLKGLSVNIDGRTFSIRHGREIIQAPSFIQIYIEDDRFFEFPVYIKKYFDLGKNLYVYISAGSGLLYFYEAEGTIALEHTEADTFTGKNTNFDGYMGNINMIPLKNKYTGIWNTGLGAGYKIKNLTFFLDVRYVGGLNSITAPEKSYLNPTLRDEFFYIDQEVNINHFEAGFSISYTLFNSVKKKKQ